MLRSQPMRKRQYPLESLADQRVRQVNEAVKGLATAVSARDAAEKRRIQIEERKAEHAARADGVRASERALLERGELTAADLARAHAWQLRVEGEAAALSADQERARATEVAATDAQRQAQTQVAARRADADVLDKHRARWTEGERKRAEAAEEEAAAEAFRPRR